MNFACWFDQTELTGVSRYFYDWPAYTMSNTSLQVSQQLRHGSQKELDHEKPRQQSSQSGEEGNCRDIH